MECEVSLPCFQEPATGFPDPIEIATVRRVFPYPFIYAWKFQVAFSFTHFTAKMLCLNTSHLPMRSAYPANLVLLYLIILTIFFEENK
jgi:hypothetical protein